MFLDFFVLRVLGLFRSEVISVFIISGCPFYSNFRYLLKIKSTHFDFLISLRIRSFLGTLEMTHVFLQKKFFF